MSDLVNVHHRFFRQGLRFVKKVINLAEVELDETIHSCEGLNTEHLLKARQQLKLASRHLAAFLDDTE